MAAPHQPSSGRWLAVGALVVEQDKILLVYNRRPGGGGHWSLPKGASEDGEPLIETLRRETLEETGLSVEPVELAFITEFYVTPRREWYLQHYFLARAVGGTAGVQARDPDVTAVRWVTQRDLPGLLTFRPWQEPVLTWLQERRPRYHLFK